MAKRIKTVEEIFKIANERGLEKPVESCNYNHCVVDETKLLIIGTLTPPEGKGFFYTAPRNKMFARIDEFLGTHENGLESLKKRLTKDVYKNKPIIEEIKSFLINNKIAFLDVIKYAVRKVGKEHSALDTDIEFCYLDGEIFEKLLKDRKDLIIVCNSVEAYQRFMLIKNERGLSLDAEYIPQKIWFASQEKTRELEKRWQKVFKKTIC